MKDKGTLTNWNGRRGFGFIKCESYDEDIFIHISALKDSARSPRVGDIIYFDRMLDESGKQRAEYASIKGVAAKPVAGVASEPDYQITASTSAQQTSDKPSFLLVITTLICVLYLYQTFSPNPIPIPVPDSVKQWLKPDDSSRPSELSKYSCQGKQYCSQMGSCDEAKFYLKNCPNVKIDGNRDGVPCEKQWCRL
jgi:cold shock CspA family protein